LKNYEIKENKVGSGGIGSLRRVRKGKNKVLKKRGIPVDWIFGKIGVIAVYTRIHFIAG